YISIVHHQRVVYTIKELSTIKDACWVCGKVGHKAQDCRHKKANPTPNNNNQANVAEDFVGVVYEANMATDSNDWWMDTGATRHICRNRNMFTTYIPTNGDENLFMGNASAANVAGKGKVVLKFTSGKD
ncbi:unnamed protein product, partial [Prunus brigantina]